MEQEQPVSAIETTYKGYKIRSRLEAKWACVFDQLGWQWEYEPIDLNGYIPDFVIKTKNDLSLNRIYVEIKPAMSYQDTIPARRKIYDAQHDGEWVILGATTSMMSTDGFIFDYVGTANVYGHTSDTPWNSWCEWAYSSIVDCIFCNGASMARFDVGRGPSIQCLHCGDTPDKGAPYPPVSRQFVNAWAAAHNATKWNPSRG